jgi:hypothetical protein
MAAPTPTARVTPTGIMLEDGFSTKITFAADTNVTLYEITVQPPGYDGGDAIETTTMFNTDFRTFAARSLKTLTEGQVTFGYDPVAFSELFTLINVPTTITVTFPDGSTLAFFGYLRTFEPEALAEGEMPTATATFQPTNVDPANHVEAAPVLTSVAGT